MPLPLEEKQGRFAAWFKRVGVAGFLFFLIKGLLWIVVSILVASGLIAE